MRKLERTLFILTNVTLMVLLRALYVAYCDLLEDHKVLQDDRDELYADSIMQLNIHR